MTHDRDTAWFLAGIVVLALAAPWITLGILWGLRIFGVYAGAVLSRGAP